MTNNKSRQHPDRTPARRFIAGAMVVMMILLAAAPRPAWACASCGCDRAQHGAFDAGGTTRNTIANEHIETRLHITEEFNDWELFLIDILFMRYFLPSMMLMTQQLSAVAMQQMEILGKFFDAKQQLETQRLFDQMKAEAHRDYHPSTGMCVFGTTVRSLAAAERRAEVTQAIMAERAQHRALGQADTAGVEGAFHDKVDRLRQFRANYCQAQDNGNALRDMCNQGASGESVNRDIDYTRLIDRRMTLEIDLTDGEPATDDERDVFALAQNLYAHDVWFRVPESLFQGVALTNKSRYLDMRAVTAKRSVAENSFNAIVGMRAMGTPEGGTPDAPGTPFAPVGSSTDTAQYLRVILQQLGLTDEEEITAMLGERPSYYAQMDILTKKMYQRPEFYTDLYDKPANVDRKNVAMQAIGLMQDFDMLKSYLRQEMILAVLVELELDHEQKIIEDRLSNLVNDGEREHQHDPPGGE